MTNINQKYAYTIKNSIQTLTSVARLALNRNLRDKSRDKKSNKSLHAAKTFSIPQGKNNSFVHALSQKFIKTPEVLFIELYPKPVSSIFTPHLSVVYENISWAHLDAYRILVFALEKGSTISPLDKDRGHRLLRDFIGPLFGISYSSLFGYGVGNSSSMNGRNIHPACSDDGKQHEDAIMEEEACENSESAAENEATSSYMSQSFTKNCVIDSACLILYQRGVEGSDCTSESVVVKGLSLIFSFLNSDFKGSSSTGEVIQVLGKQHSFIKTLFATMLTEEKIADRNLTLRVYGPPLIIANIPHSGCQVCAKQLPHYSY
jgi:hypothetical protein